MFAIVDIETTGGHAQYSGITEIAVVLFDGKKTEGIYETLVNPQMPIQPYVQSLTGITQKMVAKAPVFSAIAPHIYHLLKDRIFVAHNVNFDYAFVKQQLALCGFELNTNKICTIRLTRKIFPGLPKYGLGSICNTLQIQHTQQHRAAGDALATTELLKFLIQNDTSGHLQKMMKGKNATAYLPPHIKEEQFKALPEQPGIYYFYNQTKKIIYIGKAKNIKKRVTQHFANNKTTAQKQAFLREIHEINYKTCSSEFTASILESIEIKKWWPKYNKSQKFKEQKYGLYHFVDSKGYERLAIDKWKKQLHPLASFRHLPEAYNLLWNLIRRFELLPGLCFIDKTAITQPIPDAESYNIRVQAAIQSLEADSIICSIKDGAHYILIEKGVFFGMGLIEAEQTTLSIETLKNALTPYPENDVIKHLIQQYIRNHPEDVIHFDIASR
ncbi:MAG: GIY-YIG nuclease family protein [Hydrotalea flava]|uniref:exonuclease domain-containing protein n=1 Tax=Hydrotalea TaxID=1004300 RepID=UPI00094579CC|nr:MULTISPECIES: exonuclease domain-containing protein [Hydrotalea]MBY0348748.1 GIY-YIG nuclease family protein [Hydrotalea flava]RWZ86252.1 MAG: DNA polymerase III subunit epsilon [Hydrotalea sp. AMD]